MNRREFIKLASLTLIPGSLIPQGFSSNPVKVLRSFLGPQGLNLPADQIDEESFEFWAAKREDLSYGVDLGSIMEGLGPEAPWIRFFDVLCAEGDFCLVYIDKFSIWGPDERS